MPLNTISDMRSASGYDLVAQPHEILKDTNLVYVDCEAVKKKMHDVSLKTSKEKMIALLTRTGSVMSVEQHLPSKKMSGESAIGYRAPRYGRAAIFEVSTGHPKRTFSIEIKGCGVGPGKVPGTGKDDSGLLFLHLAIVEVINQHILNRLFEMLCLDVSCVPLLGIVDLQFDGLSDFGAQLPIANLLRDSHVRPDGNNELPQADTIVEEVKSQIQEVLEAHGMTSCGFSTSICTAWEDGKIRMRQGGKLLKLSEEHIDNLGQMLNIEAPFTLYPTNIQLTADASLEPLRARIVDLSHYKAHVITSGFCTTLVDDKPFNLNRLRPILTDRDNVPANAMINYVALRGRRVSDDPRFQTIQRVFPDWAQPDAMLSGAMTEALYLTALINAGERDIDAVYEHISKYVDTCFDVAN
ncbi:MAG: hypothetical protein ABJN34_13840 [Litoreibacter sp.]|uniref:hypothetical protein n=1 Tax=Litoreibacter sp. TaxID=1969459 RepID=UPI00329926A5